MSELIDAIMQHEDAGNVYIKDIAKSIMEEVNKS